MMDLMPDVPVPRHIVEQMLSSMRAIDTAPLQC